MLLARCDFHSSLLTVIQVGATQMFAFVVSVLNELLLICPAVSLQVAGITQHCQCRTALLQLSGHECWHVCAWHLNLVVFAHITFRRALYYNPWLYLVSQGYRCNLCHLEQPQV
jgi:hypothetical protein